MRTATAVASGRQGRFRWIAGACLLATVWAVLADEPASQPATQPAASAPAASAAEELSPNPKARAHAAPVLGLAIDPRGEFLASCGDENVRVWSMEDRTLLRPIPHMGTVVSVAFVQNKREVVAACPGEKTVKRWPIAGAASEPAGIIQVPNWESDLAWLSPTGLTLAYDTLRVLSLRSGTVLFDRFEAGSHLRYLLWTPKDSTLLLGETWGIKILTLAGAKFTTPFNDSGECDGLALSNDGRLLASAHKRKSNADLSIRLWSTQTSTLLHRIALPDREWGYRFKYHLAFSRDGRLLICGARNLKVFSLPKGEEIKSVLPHSDRGVSALCLTPDGERLVTGGGDGAIIVWSFPDLEVKAVLSDPEVPPNK